MDFSNRGKPALRELIRQADESWPDASVDKGDFASYQTARQHIWRIAHQSRQREDAVRLRVRPPVALDGLPGDEFDQIGYRALTAFQHHTLTLQDREDSIPRRRSRRPTRRGVLPIHDRHPAPTFLDRHSSLLLH
jgi:hypothetical protein